MNWDQIGVNWTQRIGALAQQQWPGLTATDIELINSQDDLNASISAYCGITEQEAQHQTQEWALRLESVDGDLPASQAQTSEPESEPGGAAAPAGQPDVQAGAPATPDEQDVPTNS